MAFSLSPEDADKPFNITTDANGFGIIRTTEVLDFEEAAEYILAIVVEDLGVNQDEKRCGN